MKKYLILETYGLGDRIYMEMIVSSLLKLPDTERIVILGSDINKQLDLITKSDKIEKYSAAFIWNKRRGMRQHPLKIFSSIYAGYKALGGRKYSDYIGLSPRGDILQKLILKLVGVKKIVNGDFMGKGTFLERMLGWNNENVFFSRERFSKKISQDIKIVPDFIASASLDREEKTIVFAPEASMSKRFLEKYKWVELSRRLQSEGWKTILVVHTCNAVTKECFGMFSEVIDLKIDTLVERISKISYAVATDSFMAHLLNACGVKTITLFGPQLPVKWAPFADESMIVYKGLKCSPCNFNLEECPLYNKGENCMQLITVEDIYNKLKSIANSE